MKSEQDIREILVDNTIRLIAEGGFEKATTKAITYSGDAVLEVKLNEAYIYRIFGSKERLYEKAFDKLDREFTQALRQCMAAYNESDEPLTKKLYTAFLKTWRFLLRSEPRCRCYIRYYYSVYFKGASLANHNRHFEEIVHNFAPLFKEKADVNAIMHSVLTTLLDFAVRVYNGDLKDNDTNALHIFNVVYCTMSSYFKDEIKEEIDLSRLSSAIRKETL